MTSSRQRRPFMLTVVAALILALTGSASALSMTAAQDTQIPEGAPVGIHSGTCGDFLIEPAYDAGEIGLATVGDFQEDEGWNAGITDDPEVGAFGVDLNDDDGLSEEEVVGPIDDTDITFGYAEADFDSGVDESEPYIVAVHAAPDQYETILACGSIADTIEGDDGMRYIPLQSTENSQLFGYSVLGDDNTSLRTFLFERGELPQQPAAEVEELAGYPIEVHEGTCEDWVTEPAYTIGDMLETNVAAEGEQGPGEIEAEIPAEAENLGAVYKVDVETDFDGNELIENDVPYVVAVHMDAGENYTNLIACGQVLEILDDDQLYVMLQPVGTSDMTGFVNIDREEGNLIGYLWSCEPLLPAPPEATPTPVPTEEPTPTPTEAVVVEATAVVTEVIVETEVVGAATATAIAEEGGVNLIIVEIGAESPGEVVAAPGESLRVTNQSDVERVFAIPDLGIEETVPAGGSVDVTVPTDVEAGTYSYQVLENDEPVFEDSFIIDE